ncbi:MAG: MFS transporter, partial [Candidatus Competibacter sp.]
LLLLVPERESDEAAAGDWRAQWRETAGLFRSPVFWRIAPCAVLSQASFLTIQGLWAGPWLRDVSGLDKLAAASCLFWVAVAMVGGFLGMGQLAYRLTRHSIPPLAVSASGMALFMGVQLAILLDWGPLLPLWISFGFFGTSGVLSYAVLSQSFPLALSGRVNTALNLLVFVAAFAGQWGMGAIVNHWPLAGGGYADVGYRWAFGLVLGGQLITWVWLLLGNGQRGETR